MPEDIAPQEVEALVVGAGPAGLMAAEALSARGARVVVAEAMPSPGRKLLMAGKSGLNLTKEEPEADFRAAYAEAAGPLEPMLDRFGPQAVRAWAEGLGERLFTGSSGRVFPKAMKASPLLRAWLARLDGRGVELRRRWRWTGWAEAAGGAAAPDARPGLRFDTPEGPRILRANVVVLALGGASWPHLGSDGAWTGMLAARGAPLTPFQPANMGLRVAWSEKMARHFGAPVKPIALQAGGRRARGECVISARGLEGGGIYAVARPVREGAALTLDLIPDLDAKTAAARLARPRRGASLSQHLRKALRLDPARRALAQEFARPLPEDPAALAALLKALPVAHDGPRPLAEAISTAGGVAWAGLDAALMLRALPGVFCAGEMLDWEAPTGGYLLTACLASGLAAGEGAADRLGLAAAPSGPRPGAGAS